MPKKRENVKDYRHRLLAEVKKVLRKEGCPKAQINKVENAVMRALRL